MELDGARVLVAGASGVLGAAIAQALRGRGARLVVRAAVPRLEGDGTVAVLSAILADHPTAGMAAYTAELVVDGIRDERRELRYDLRERAFTGR